MRSQLDYGGSRWKRKREHILKRDQHMDQVVLRDGIRVEATVVHHILPAEEFPEYAWEDWNLVSVAEATHRKLHDKYTGRLSPDGYALAREVAEDHGVQLTETILVIGLPGTGKTTWARQHVQGGLVYDLDEIAKAFRLSPEKDAHAGARRMAAALRPAWIAAAAAYTSRIIVVRTAPDYEELSETSPDKVVVCTKQYTRRGFRYDEAEDSKRINDIIEWAEANHVPVIYNPEKHEVES